MIKGNVRSKRYVKGSTYKSRVILFRVRCVFNHHLAAILYGICSLVETFLFPIRILPVRPSYDYSGYPDEYIRTSPPSTRPQAVATVVIEALERVKRRKKKRFGMITGSFFSFSLSLLYYR